MKLLILFRQQPLRVQIIFLIVFVLALPLIVANIQISKDNDDRLREQANEKAQMVANSIASSRQVVESLSNPTHQSRQEAQDFSHLIQKVAGVEFIVVIDMNAVRISHPDPAKVGKQMVGNDEGRVLKGEAYFSSAQGSLGLSQRAFVPIFDGSGHQVGAVVVGILTSSIDKAAARVNQSILSALTLALLIGVVLAVLLSNSIKKTLFGLEPLEIARQLGERNAVLESVREGIVAIDSDGRLVVVNNEAKRILSLAGILDNLLGHKVDEYIPHTRLSDILISGEPEFDREQDLNGIRILTNRIPLYANGEVVGAIATFRDMSEISKLAEELTGVNRYVEALRSSAHEFLNKLHVINGLVHSNNRQALIDYLSDIINENKDEQKFISEVIHEPILAAFLTSKFSRAREMGVDLLLEIDDVLPQIVKPEVSHAMVTLLGNLLDNAFDAVQVSETKEVNLHLARQDDNWTIEVSDHGPGIPANLIPDIFQRGFSTKGEHRGLGLFLVSAALNKLHGTMDVSSQKGCGMTFFIRIPSEVIENND
ncbi:DcuS/MalK family sensor histidine kinase [Citrobacter portucalensis]|uniref:DcuS/MalK family sensor histidine kinase n=5 Tax=Citrobacter portucalensis TaxID=1639133 RepID=UPI0022430D32|nr:DcuS/MalK family sensor histidine kinase [Citrobacter portucalensis]MCW8353847.1 DcuS/MalK family sensor histidine kinase [Citrobacter portucalensis]MCX8992112.1 DcuS/MalK family sensor histidine kinase [Citrobacter portucalensis]MCX9006310.1 DcuS/MalK family sensor histidine kinase [Citrobacter portucalensis]